MEKKEEESLYFRRKENPRERCKRKPQLMSDPFLFLISMFTMEKRGSPYREQVPSYQDIY